MAIKRNQMLKKLRSTPPSTPSIVDSKSQHSIRSSHKKGQDMDLTHLFQPPEHCGFTISYQSSQPNEGALEARRVDTDFEIISSRELNSEFRKVRFSLCKRGARFAMPLSEMYKYISYIAYEAKLTDYENAGQERKLVLLDVKTKEIEPDAPLILYCHGSERDLGSLTHYFVDLASQMKAEVLSFQLPNFGPQDEKSTKITESLIMSYAQVAFDFAYEMLTNTSRKVFIYGQGSGSIPAVELAQLHSGQVSGLILQDAIIEFKKKKGLIFKRLVREDKYLKVVGELDRVSVLLFHGTQGKLAPFNYAQDIMDKLFNGNNGKKSRSVVEERKVKSEIGGKSVVRNTSILENIIGKKKKQRYKFEGYFVECDNGEVMNLKRSTYYSVLREFIIDASALEAQNIEIMMNPFEAASQISKIGQLNKSQTSSPPNSSRSLYKYQKTMQQESAFFNLSLMRLQSCEELDQSKEEEDNPFDHAVSPTNLDQSNAEAVRLQSPTSASRMNLLDRVKDILLEGKGEEEHLDSNEHNVSTSPGTKQGTPKGIEEHRSFLKLRRGNLPIRREWQLKDEEKMLSFLSSKLSDSENVKEEGEEYGAFLQPVSLINPRKLSAYDEKEL